MMISIISSIIPIASMLRGAWNDIGIFMPISPSLRPCASITISIMVTRTIENQISSASLLAKIPPRLIFFYQISSNKIDLREHKLRTQRVLKIPYYYEKIGLIGNSRTKNFITNSYVISGTVRVN